MKCKLCGVIIVNDIACRNKKNNYICYNCFNGLEYTIIKNGKCLKKVSPFNPFIVARHIVREYICKK